MRHLPGDRRCVLIIDDDPVFTLSPARRWRRRFGAYPWLTGSARRWNCWRKPPLLLDVELPQREQIRPVREAALDARRDCNI